MAAVTLFGLHGAYLIFTVAAILFATWLAVLAFEYDFIPIRRFLSVLRRPICEIAVLVVIVLGFVRAGATKNTNGLDRTGETWEVSRRGAEAQREDVHLRNGVSETNLWFTGIECQSNSVLIGAAWKAGAFSAPPFLEFYVCTNLSDNESWVIPGWAEALPGETNLVVEIGASRLPGGEMPSALFVKMEGEDGIASELGDHDEDGIANDIERSIGTNPRRADTDGDGFPDGIEAARVSYGDSLPEFNLSSLTNVLTSVSLYQPCQASVTVDIPFFVELADHRSNRADVHFSGIVAFFDEGASGTSEHYYALAAPSTLYGTSRAAVAAYCGDFMPMGYQIRAGIVNGTQGRWFVVEWRDMMHLYDYYSLTLERSTFQLAVSEAEPDKVFVRYNTLEGRIDGSTGIVGAHGFNGTPDFLVGDCDYGSVTNGMTITYTFGTGTNPLNPDTDGDLLRDGWEVAHGMNPLMHNAADGNPRTNADADPDLDGLTNQQESSRGTNPFQPDSDGDGMDDGWEVRYGFDPKVHNSQTSRADDDADYDADEDGLTNAEECAWNTNPSALDADGDGVADGSDTDRDGVNDGAEVAQNSDPNDATDEGKPDSRVPVSFYFGDHSSSHSEKYSLRLLPVDGSGIGNAPRRYTRVNQQYGECETNKFLIARGWLYEIQLAHAGTSRTSSPDFDYTLEAISADYVRFDETNALFGVINADDVFTAEGKKAKMFVVEQVAMTNSIALSKDEFVYISSQPLMPEFSARLYPTGLVGNVDMQLKIEYLRAPASQTTYYPSNLLQHTMAASNVWQIANDVGSDFRGGRAQLNGTYGDFAYTNIFHIRGQNPADADVEAAIGDSLWYLKAIARHESGRQNGRNYCQFNEVGVLGTSWGNYRACPNFGAPNGWGIFMLDPPVNKETLWNWRTNVNQGTSLVYNVCIPAATQWMNRQVAQQQLEEPTMPLAEQTFIIGGVEFREGTDRTPVDACAIQRYNGASRWVIYWRNRTPTRPGAWCIQNSATNYVASVMERLDE